MILSPAEPTVTAVLLIVGYSGEKYFQTARKFKVPNSAKKTPLTPHSTQEPLCAIPHQLVTSGQRPPLFGVRRDLMRGTSGKCTLPATRTWQTTPLAAPRQCPIHTNPPSAAPATSPNFAAPLAAPRRVRRQHSKVAVPMLARRWRQCRNPIQKLTCA